MESIVNWINGYVWSPPMLLLVLGGGLFFSILFKFVQLRKLKEMVKLTFYSATKEKHSTGVTSFQALALSVASRVGTGNIAGVATAIAAGGPGAVFWMWVVATLGAATSFVESTLAQIYKEKHEGQFRGGPAYYIEKGLKNKPLAMIFAVVAMLAFSAGLNLPQSNTIAVSVEQAFGVSPMITGTMIALLFAIVVFGGVKRIAKVAEKVVPFMAVAYILISLALIIVNITALPSVIALIVKSAFNFKAGFGALIGTAIMNGVKRGVYSNEAGMGTAPHAAAAANVKHPVEQGLVQSFSVYIDTLFVCTATAFMIIITGMYNFGDHQGALTATGEVVSAGPVYTQMALNTLFNGWGSVFVAISVMFFAFTTMIALFYYGETNLVYLMKGENKIIMNIFRAFTVAALFWASINSSAVIWGLSDLGMGLTTWINIVVILLLHKPALKAFRDYESQKANGIDTPLFDPSSLGIDNADYWTSDDIVKSDIRKDELSRKTSV